MALLVKPGRDNTTGLIPMQQGAGLQAPAGYRAPLVTDVASPKGYWVPLSGAEVPESSSSSPLLSALGTGGTRGGTTPTVAATPALQGTSGTAGSLAPAASTAVRPTALAGPSVANTPAGQTARGLAVEADRERDPLLRALYGAK